jgi:hypothetical protein
VGSGIACSGTTYPGTDAGIAQFIACEGGTIQDAATDSGTLLGFAASAGCPSSGGETWPAPLAVACMRARKMLYKCSTGTVSGAGTNLDLSLAKTGLVAGEKALASAGVLSGMATMGIGTAVTLVITGLTDLIQHHAQAVANEQKTICAVCNAFNQFETQIESELAAGTITVTQAIALLTQAVNQLSPSLTSLSGGKLDALWGYNLAMQAYALYLQKVVYPVLAPSPATAISELSGSTSVAGVPVPNYALWIGGGLILAKLLGVI